jgi:hypothetical protein
METQEQPTSLENMNHALRDKLALLRTLFATAAADNIKARYKIGVIIAEVRAAEDRYGSRAVATLAVALGRDEATLYRYGTVAATWSEAQVERLLDRSGVDGQPLSWSHLIYVATAPSSRREELVNQVLSEGLSVRALKGRVCADGVHAPVRGALPEAHSLVGLKRLVHAIESLTKRVEAHRIGEAWPSDPELESLLERAVLAQDRLYRISVHNLERLRSKRERESLDTERPSGERPGSPKRKAMSVPRLLAGCVA